MKILVAIKRVVDTNIHLRLNAEGTDMDTANVKKSLNPFCEIAVEEAVRLKEQGFASEVIVTTIGVVAAQEQLRTALAMGADRAIWVDSALEPPLDP